jgi:UPF0716 family protein affecting phage T7 exclusion
MRLPVDLDEGRKRVGRIVRLTLGWVMTVAGLILIPVPILPGFVLLLPGLALLCAETRWIRRLLRRFKEYRMMRRALREAEKVGLKIDLDGEEDRDDPSAPR